MKKILLIILPMLLLAFNVQSLKAITVIIDTVPITAPASTGVTWSNMPSALTELYGRSIYRVLYDPLNQTLFSNFTQVRLGVNVQTAGYVDAVLAVQSASSQGGTWDFIDGVSEPSVSIQQANRLEFSNWVDVSDTSDYYFRVVGRYGDGVADPSFGLIFMQFRYEFQEETGGGGGDEGFITGLTSGGLLGIFLGAIAIYPFARKKH